MSLLFNFQGASCLRSRERQPCYYITFKPSCQYLFQTFFKFFLPVFYSVFKWLLSATLTVYHFLNFLSIPFQNFFSFFARYLSFGFSVPVSLTALLFYHRKPSLSIDFLILIFILIKCQKLPNLGALFVQLAYLDVIPRYSSRHLPLLYTSLAISLPRYLTCQGSYI